MARLRSSLRLTGLGWRERIIDRTPEGAVQADAVEGKQLHQQHRGEMVRGIHPEQRAVTPVPEALANLARVLFGIDRRAQAHGKVDAEAYLTLVRQPGAIRDRLVQVV